MVAIWVHRRLALAAHKSATVRNFSYNKKPGTKRQFRCRAAVVVSPHVDVALRQLSDRKIAEIDEGVGSDDEVRGRRRRTEAPTEERPN